MSGNVRTVLDGLRDALQGITMNRIGVMAQEMIRNHIYRGNGFAPLSPATTAYRGNGKPLMDTGSLRDIGSLWGSITFEAGKDTVSVGTVRKDAPLHNDGGVITARKSWLYIPAAGTRRLQRRYGYKPGEVLAGLKADGCSVFRIGRTVCYKRNRRGAEPRTVYYLKKSVEIPKREFFYRTDKEADLILKELGSEIL